MLGNDVVDLRDPDSLGDGRHARFDLRVFDATERALIAASDDGDRLRGLLWAAKESAYKAARKEAPPAVFAPTRFAVRLVGPWRAVVTVGGRRYRVDVAADEERVHAVARAADDPQTAIYAAVGTLSFPTTAVERVATASAAVRRLAVDTLAGMLRVAPEDLAIHRERRIPRLWIGGRPSSADLSLSHHGRFVAFACALPRPAGVA